jgi:hypothetical protein
MSRQKTRQHDRLTPEQQLEDEVRRLADHPCVDSVSDHFAGAYNELGLTIHLTPASSDTDYWALRETLLDALPTPSAGTTIWMLIFNRDGKIVGTAFPGDR